MIFETHIPAEPIHKYIDAFMYFKAYMPAHSIEKVVPDGFLYLIFELDDKVRYEIDPDSLEKRSERKRAWISGMQTQYIVINAHPDSEMFIVKFKPYGAFPFFHQAISSLNNRIIPAHELLGNSIYDLRKEMLDTQSPKEKMQLSEQYFQQRFDPQKIPETYIINTCEQIQHDPGLELQSLADMIAQSGVSKKHFTQLFKKYVGLSPKQLQRIFRFSEILQTIQRKDQMPWSQIALSCGYYDQAHFIKEFKAFCGTNPSKFITDHQDSDRLNFFPLD